MRDHEFSRGQAKSGNAALISGYLGGGKTVDRAMGKFALAYADQNETDHAVLVAAVKKGRTQGTGRRAAITLTPVRPDPATD